VNEETATFGTWFFVALVIGAVIVIIIAYIRMKLAEQKDSMKSPFTADKGGYYMYYPYL
jgi:hypothetical protein